MVYKVFSLALATLRYMINTIDNISPIPRTQRSTLRHQQHNMASHGDLLASGLLYVGNWEKWKVRMAAVLRLHGLDMRWKDSSFDGLAVYPTSKRHWKDMSHDATILIRCSISPELFQRIAMEDISEPVHLIKRLEELVHRFRFLDLLQNCVIAYISILSPRHT